MTTTETPSSHPWGTRLAEAFVTRRGIILALLLGTTGLAGWLAPSVEFEPDITKMLPEDNFAVETGRLLEERSQFSRTVLLDVRADAVEEVLPDLVESLRTSPFIAQVVATREEFLAAEGERIRQAPIYHLSETTVTALVERLAPEGRRQAIEDARTRLSQDPLAGREVVLRDPLGLRWLIEQGIQDALPVSVAQGTQYVIFEGGDRALLRIVGKKPSFDLKFSEGLLADLQSRLDDHDVIAHLRGGYRQAQLDRQRIGRDLRNSVLTSLLLVGIFLTLSMRRLLDPLVVFMPVVIAVFWTLPIGSALLGKMTPLTVSAAAILIGLGVDFTLHVLERYHSERRQLSHDAAAIMTLRTIGKPLFVGMVTTVVAFLSLEFADFSGLRIFGALLALGLGFAFLCTLMVMPMVLRITTPPTEEPRQSWFVRWCERQRSSPRGVRWTQAMALLVVIAVGGIALRGVKLSSDLKFLRPEESQFMRDQEAFEEEIGFAMMSAALLIPVEVPIGQVAEGLEKLRGLDQVPLSFGLHLSVATLKAKRRVAEFRERISGWVEATLGDLDSAGFRAGPFRAGLEGFEQMFLADPMLSPDEVSRSAVTIGERSYHFIICHPRRNIASQPQWEQFKQTVDSTFGSRVEAFHVQELLAQMHALLWKDLLRAGLITMALALVTVTWLCGGLIPGLLALVPTLCGLTITLGVLAYTGTPLNMGNCVIIPFLLGIGVDQGVHLVAHFRRTGQLQSGSCGRAIWRSSVTTGLGFGSLITAETPGIASLGWITILGVSVSVLTSFLVVPQLWKMFCAPGGAADDPDRAVFARESKPVEETD